MSGIVGHTTYAILALREALKRKLRTAPLAARYYPSFLAGAYLGSDVQTMPSVTCTATGQDAGYGAIAYSGCPGGASTPWVLKADGESYRPLQLSNLFYGRAHLIFGWAKEDEALRVPWDHLPEYFAACLEDAMDLYGPSERTLAYILGWSVHVVSDSLIKSFQPGLSLKLLDGTYTPRNRPIQDLFAFHEIGIKELGLNWAATLEDIASTPVEPAQAHYMRVAEPRGQLARLFPDGWIPRKHSLLLATLAENRRWGHHHFADELAEMRLEKDARGNPEASEAARKKTGLQFAEMMDAARQSHLREQIGQIGSEAASMIEAIERRSARLRAISTVPF